MSMRALRVTAVIPPGEIDGETSHDTMFGDVRVRVRTGVGPRSSPE